MALGLLFLIGAGGCAARPSAQPLGEGPLAKKERAEEALKEVRRDRTARKKRLAELELLAEEVEAEQAVEVTFDWDWDGGEGDEEGDGGTAHASGTKGAADAGDAGSDAEATAKNFAGEYVGDDESWYRFGSMPSRRERDDKARTRVTEKDEEHLTITPIDSSNGNEICNLEAERSGDSATVNADQHCFDQESDESSLTGTVRSGRASFKKDRMLLDLELDLLMVVGDDELTGTLKYHFRGERKKGG